jgi:general stress protein 26
MAGEENTNKSQSELVDRVWELSKSIGTALLTTWDGKEQSMRPMSAKVERNESAVHFLAAVDSPPVQHIERFDAVVLGFTESKKCVTLNGHARISNDRAKIKELWTPFAKAWWDSAEDPRIRVITVTPDHAELWDSPGSLIASAIMLTAAATGTKPAVGDHAKVAL